MFSKQREARALSLYKPKHSSLVCRTAATAALIHGKTTLSLVLETLEGRVFLSAASIRLAAHAVRPVIQRGSFSGGGVPGLIQAENFDTGGEGVAYHDTTRLNEGGAYRLGERVDLFQVKGLPNPNYVVGSAHTGEWLEYTIAASNTANYDLIFNVASSGVVGGTFHVNVDGKVRTPLLTVPATKRSAYATVNGGAISLTAGTHVVRVVMDSEGGSGEVGRFDSFSLIVNPPAAPTQLIAARNSDASVSLIWRDNSNNESMFWIERTTDPSGGWQGVASTKASRQSWTDTGTTAGQSFYYRVRAINDTLASGNSNVAFVPAVTPVITAPAPTIIISRGGTYSGNWESTDPNTPAVQILTNEPVVIQNSQIRSRGTLIYVQDGGNVTIRNNKGYGENPNVYGGFVGRFLDVNGFANLDVENNYLESTGGIYLYNYEGNHTAVQTVKILRNVAANIDGRESDGNGGWLAVNANSDNYKQFLQTNGLTNLSGAEVAWNQVINEQGRSRVEESINIHATTGTPASPFLIHDNYIQGAFPSNAADATDYSGGGIMVSDNGSAYIHAFNNEVVATGGIGIEISSGHDNSIYSNRIIASGLAPDGSAAPWSNTGAVIWNFNGERTFTNNTGFNNVIGWVSNGNRNDFWVPDASSWTNNAAIGGDITLNSEIAEFAIWHQKLSSAGISVGPRAG